MKLLDAVHSDAGTFHSCAAAAISISRAVAPALRRYSWELRMVRLPTAAMLPQTRLRFTVALAGAAAADDDGIVRADHDPGVDLDRRFGLLRERGGKAESDGQAAADRGGLLQELPARRFEFAGEFPGHGRPLCLRRLQGLRRGVD